METGVPGENFSVQSREPTNSTHIWRRVWESNPGHICGRRVLSSLRHPFTSSYHCWGSLHNSSLHNSTNQTELENFSFKRGQKRKWQKFLNRVKTIQNKAKPNGNHGRRRRIVGEIENVEADPFTFRHSFFTACKLSPLHAQSRFWSSVGQ